MKLGEAMYKAQAGGGRRRRGGEHEAAKDDVIDADFKEVGRTTTRSAGPERSQARAATRNVPAPCLARRHQA